MSTITSSVNISSIIDYNWPITISGGTLSNPITIIINNGIILNSVNNYFIIGSDYITIRGEYTYMSITINNVTSGYPGLIKNGDNSNNGYNNITIKDITINSTNNSVLKENGGWLCQSYFGKNTLNNLIDTCECKCDINGVGGGGIVGAYSGGTENNKLRISKCYFVYNYISANNSGGICGAYCGNVNIDNSYSKPYEIRGDNCGGIIGAYSKDNLVLSLCYTIHGNTMSGNYVGGIIGAYSNCNNLNISNCYCRIDNISGNYSGGIIGAYFAPKNNTTISNCYIQCERINGSNSGGIIGANIGYNTNVTITIEKCYFIGEIKKYDFNPTINNGCSGIIGGYNSNDTSTIKPTINLKNCYIYHTNISSKDNDPSLNIISLNIISKINYIPSKIYSTYNWVNNTAQSTLDNTDDTWTFNSTDGVPALLKVFDNNTLPYIYSIVRRPVFNFGSPITFSIKTMGTPPITYKWYNNRSEEIQGETSSTYTINNMQLTDIGNYSCNVSNNNLNYNTSLYFFLEKARSISNNITINNIESFYWPLLIFGGTQTDPVIITLNNLTLTSSDHYFKLEEENIHIIGNNNTVITIDNVTNYPGLIYSRDFYYNNITISNIKISSINNSTLISNGGWLCQTKFLTGNPYVNNLISDCIINADINGTNGGGILGAYSGDYSGYYKGRLRIENCSCTGEIKSQGAGGIIGSNSSCIIISNCYSTGNITGKNSGGICGSSVGGFYGLIDISNCYSTGNIIGENAGGICGDNFGYSSDECKIDKCFSFGTISGLRAGGIVGSNIGNTFYYGTSMNITITNSYSLGNISNGCGGIIGNYNIIDEYPSAPNITIKNCYTYGTYNSSDNDGIIGKDILSHINYTPACLYPSNNKWSNNSAFSILLNNDNIWNRNNIDSIPATLTSFTETTPLYITKQPVTIDNTDLYVEAIGSNLSYQWYNTNGIIEGAISNRYAFISQTDTYYVRISNTFGNIQSISITPTIIYSPTITSITPNNGNFSGGKTVTIIGTNFSSTNLSVFFGSELCYNVTYIDSKTIIAVSPAKKDSLIVYITVQTSNGTSNNSDPFTYCDVPTTPLNLVSNDPGDSTVNISWSEPSYGAPILSYTIKCYKENNSDFVFTNNYTTSLKYRTITGLENNKKYKFKVYATNSQGNSPDSEFSSTIIPYAPPVIDGITPYGSSITGSVTVTINGSDFYSPIVLFGELIIPGKLVTDKVNKTSIDINFTNDSTSNILKFTLPTNHVSNLPANHISNDGRVNLTVINNITNASSTLNNCFTYFNAPTIESVSPQTGTAIGTNIITITGNYFNNSSVSIGGNNAFINNSVNDLITITAPPGTGVKDITIITLGGSVTLPSAYTYVEPPTITSSKLTSSNLLVIDGTNLNYSPTVKINDTDTDTTIATATQTQLIITKNTDFAINDAIKVTTLGGMSTFILNTIDINNPSSYQPSKVSSFTTVTA